MFRRLVLVVMGMGFLMPALAQQDIATFCGPAGFTATGVPCVPMPPSFGATGVPQAGQVPQQGGLNQPPTIDRQPQSATQLPGAGLMPQFGNGIAERHEFQDFIAQSLGRDLPMFGYSLFQNVPSTFAPLDRVPVTPDYVIGPGDEILIRAWGQVEMDYRLFVDRNGAINIPKVGAINVAGIKFQELQGYLRTTIGRIFRNFDLNVTMGQLRSVQIFIVGQALRPGTYTVSSLSTLVNAVFASGGPTVKGSMRSIQLKRGDKLVTEFDMYDLLLKGDKSKDAPLQPGDVIYIPPIGQLAAISGSVNAPAIYEIKGRTKLADLIDLAGGLTITADGQKVAVERIVDRRMRKVEDFRLDKEGLAHDLQDGDLVQVLPLSPRFDNAVTVRGNVAVPARHPWRNGLRVKDVVPDKEALIVPDYWVKRNLSVRTDTSGQLRESVLFRPDTTGQFRPDTTGQFRPDTTGQSRPDATGQFRPDATGQFPPDGTGQSPPDAIGQLRERFSTRPDITAQLRERERQSLATRAEGVQQKLRADIKRTLAEVNWDYAVIERLNLNDLTAMLIPFNLGKAILEGDPQNNLLLQPGDVITIFSKEDIQVPVAKQTLFVRLEGEIVGSGVYQVKPGETLRQLVARIGGLTPNAYLFGTEFTRESTRVLQQKRLDEVLNRFEQAVQRHLTAAPQTAVTPESLGAAKAAGEGQFAMIARLRKIKATGRIVLEISPEQGQLKDLPDLTLEDGDSLTVPPRPSTVAVVGTVYNENAFIYRPEKRVSDYLAQAGGATVDADTSSLYIIRADGSVISRRQSGGWLFGDSFQGERLMPGDTVVVPEKLEKFSLSKELRDWSQIFYQFALGVAGLKVLKGF